MTQSKAYKLPEDIEEAIVAESRSSYGLHTSVCLAVLAWDAMALRKRAFTLSQL